MSWYHWLIGAILTWTFYVFGQSPLPDSAGAGDIFIEVVKLFQDSKGLSYQYKISATLFILVAIFKNSSLQPYWERLGKHKPLVAPSLSLIAFLFMVQPFTLKAAMAAIATGAAAGYFAQILDAVKTIPKVGSLITFVSETYSKIFKKP
jgi:uncharacterized membrane protein YbaN (DUF454 family)